MPVKNKSKTIDMDEQLKTLMVLLTEMRDG